MKQIAASGQKANFDHTDIPGHLFHPVFIRVGRDTGDMNLPDSDVNEKKNITGDQTSFCDRFGCKEITGSQNIFMGFDKIMPGDILPSFGSRRDSIFSQDIADRLIADVYLSFNSNILISKGVNSNLRDGDSFPLLILPA